MNSRPARVVQGKKRSKAAVTVRLAYCLVCLLLVAGDASALDPNLHITQYMHNSWRVQDGSLPAGMFSIAQSPDGFIWLLSVSHGIFRFDGVRFVHWTLDTDGDASHISNLLGDRTGGLWIVRERDIVHLQNGAVTSSVALQSAQSEGATQGPDGSLWVVRSSNNTTADPLCQIMKAALKCFGKADGIPISPLDSLLADGKGGFWLGGQTSLVHWHDGKSDVYPIEALKSNAGQHGIVSLAFGPDGSLWVGILAEGPGLGLGRLVGGSFKPFVTPSFDGSKVAVIRMIQDSDGNLWVATEGRGLFRIRGSVVDHYGRAEGLSGDMVFDIFQDREGIIWTATANGIDSFRDARVATFSAVEGLGKDAVAGVRASRDGSIWVANAESLDHIENGVVSSIRTGSGLPGHQVTYLLEDRAGNLWVGVDDELYVFKNGRFRRLPEPGGKPLGMVVGLAEDKDGNIWAECASSPRKLLRIRDFQVREELPATHFLAGRTLAPGPNGGIWIATIQGDLASFRQGALQTFPLHTPGSPRRHQLVAEPDGSVLVDSEDGLVVWREGRVQRMTTENGLPCNTVFSFVKDKENRWWLYAKCGVVELTDSELQKWWANPKTVVNTRLYDVFDGAQPESPSFNSGTLSADGRVWFANGVVLQMVDPARPPQKALPAMTYIESVTVDRKRFSATGNLKLPPHPRELQVDYTSPTLLIPQRVKFRYRLDGFDSDWHEAGTRRQAFYTDLPPGNYSFRVIACNSDGVWSESPASLDFSVAPAYYQTYWFCALCAATLLAMLWTAYRMRVRHLNKQFEVTLDTRVAERTRIARDLHDTLLQSAHGVLLRFQTVSHLLPERPVEAKERLDAAIDQTAEFITEARDQVQGLRESTVQGNDLALAINTLGEELAAAPNNHQSSFRVAVEGTPRDLHPIVRDEIYRIATEALRNAFRHAEAHQVEAEIRYDNEQFRLRVRDDGKGIDPAVLSSSRSEGHFGLPGMRERAKLIGGKLTVWSEVDAGTEVELRVPAGVAYASARRGLWLSRFAARAKV